MPNALLILAAGRGTRMKSDAPKVLHQLGGVPMLHHAMAAAGPLKSDRVVVVAGFGASQVEAAAKSFDTTVDIVVQKEQLGTGHAVRVAKDELAGFKGDIFVLYGDTPFITAQTLEKMSKARKDGAAVVVLGFEADDPALYGRLVLNENGLLVKIVEARDADAIQQDITLCNSGVVCAEAAVLYDLVAEIGNNNKAQEYYLTDIVEIANQKELKCSVVTCPQTETFGINSRSELAAAEAVFQRDARHAALENGVTLQDPDSTIFAFDTLIGRDVVVAPHVVFGPGVTVESGAEIRAFSHLEGCHIGADVTIGPFARLRPGAEIGDTARVGNFVEVKAAQVGNGAKINHLTYIGDADIGADANIGAGTVTCNYDGVLKHKTIVGEGAFIGSNTSLVAPVSVGAKAMTGSGSVISKDVPAQALGISRPRQANVPEFATKLMARLTAIKSSRKKPDQDQ